MAYLTNCPADEGASQQEVITNLPLVKNGILQAQANPVLPRSKALFRQQVHLFRLKSIQRLFTVANRPVDHSALGHQRVPLGGIGAFPGEDIHPHLRNLPGNAIILGICLQRVYAVGRHSQAENRLIPIGRAEIRPGEVAVMGYDVLAVLIDRVAQRSLANKIQPAMDVRLPMHPVPILVDRVLLKEPQVGVNGVIGAAAEKSAASLKYVQNSFRSP